MYNYTQKDNSPASTAIHEYAKRGTTWFNIDVAAASQGKGLSRDSLVAKLNEWNDRGYIVLRATKRWNRYGVLKDLPTDENEINDIADQMFARLSQREQDEVGRMERVFDWAADSQCLAKGLALYFGDTESFPNDGVCGKCTVCKSGGKPATTYKYVPPPFNEDAFSKILAFADVHDDARFLARVAFGITSPRITTLKLSSSPVFGTMSDHRWEDLMARCDTIVEQWWLDNPDGPTTEEVGGRGPPKPKPAAKAPAKRKAPASASGSSYGGRGGGRGGGSNWPPRKRVYR